MKIKVNLKDHNYSVLISTDSLGELIQKINALNPTKCLLIIDKNVDTLHKNYIRKFFANVDSSILKYVFNATERNKSITQTTKIYRFLSSNNFDRHSVIVAVGGGITGDIAGFASSTFMRGLKYFHVPTTLLSMVDSSVGGKTGINFDLRKNLIGTFYQPEGVYVDKRFLNTLPYREIISGVGEIFKYAFLSNEKNYNILRKVIESVFDSNKLPSEKSIKICLEIKSDVVSQDEKEVTGLRKILNLGHTFAHAFEAETKYKLKHGEAVLAGVTCAIFLSEKLGYMTTQKMVQYLNDFKFLRFSKILSKVDEQKIYSSMFGDKKNLYGELKMVVIEDIGRIIVDVPANKSDIIDSIKKLKDLI